MDAGWRKTLIDDWYDKYLEKVKGGGWVSGDPINLDDPKEVAVAFYTLAEREMIKSNRSSINLMEDIIKDLRKRLATAIAQLETAYNVK